MVGGVCFVAGVGLIIADLQIGLRLMCAVFVSVVSSFFCSLIVVLFDMVLLRWLVAMFGCSLLVFRWWAD